MEKYSLDPIDQTILQLLQQDAKMGTKEIAARVGLTQTPTFERIKRLERWGVIKKYSIQIDRKKLGVELGVFCLVSLKNHSIETLKTFEDAIREFDEVSNCYYIAGTFDYSLYIEVKDMEEYQRFLTLKLASISNIAQVQSAFVMNSIKEA